MKRIVSGITRRDFLAATAAGATLPRIALSGKGPETSAKVAMLHATDLFRPYNDPDDHWDLACLYALAHRGDTLRCASRDRLIDLIRREYRAMRRSEAKQLA